MDPRRLEFNPNRLRIRRGEFFNPNHTSNLKATRITTPLRLWLPACFLGPANFALVPSAGFCIATGFCWGAFVQEHIK